MSRTQYQRAERCFALARSTTFPAERETAIERGTKIAEAAGISLDEFDIPGRQRSARTKDERLFEGVYSFGGTNFRYARATIHADEMMDAINEMVARFTQAEAMREERARRASYAYREGLDDAVRFLAGQGVKIRVEGERYFQTTPAGHVIVLTGHDVVSLARRRGWTG